ncbi:S-layer homology domain-containing protein [Cohnella caldifontis]|uniref:S-layer homology domain-containing protein n=1 Tax=Cohnella caldifontis TaxID=3027471 RepID=UPI0023EDF607|nr:S-layer homology domain-containing protein [Cohnella sp. YIM B05605]
MNAWCAKGLLILALVFAMVTGPLGSPAAADTPPFPGSGSGTASDPYIITSYEGLDWMRNTVKTNTFYKLGNDITFEDDQVWQPVGKDLSSYFQGTLDGDGHTIRNLTIDNSTDANIGLFGILFNGTVKNLKLENVNVKVTNPSPSSNFVGALVGYARGSTRIENVSVTGQVIGNNSSYAGLLGGYLANTTTVSNVYLNGTVKSSGMFTGGVAGALSDQPNITNSVVHASLEVTSTAPYAYVGLVAGETSTGGKITNVSASGSYSGNTGSASNWAVGGMIGRANTGLVITNSFVSASGFPSYAGGICKQIFGGSSFTVDNSFWDTEVSGISTSCGGTGKSTTEMKQATTYSAWVTTVWKISDGQYPQLILLPQIVIDASGLSPAGSGTVTVNGYTFDGTFVTEYKWASGVKGLEDFRTGGGTSFTDAFDISAPGAYTVYVKNGNGADAVKSFTVKSAALNSLSAKDVGSTPNKDLSLTYDSTNFTYSGVVSSNVTSVRFYPVPADSAATIVMKDGDGKDLSGNAGSGFSDTLSGNGTQRYTIAVTNGGLSQEYKLELRTASPLNVTLTPSTTGATKKVTVNIEASGDDNSADAIRWAQGIRTIEDFSNESFGHDLTGKINAEDDVSKADFEVEENGVYTVYVRDAFSTPSVSTIRIENIVKDAPSISFGDPVPDEPTAGEVSVPVTVSVYGFDNGLKEARWKPGQLNADSFAGGAGTDLMSGLTVTGAVYQGQLTVSENGWYTVYVSDLVGNESVNSVNVTNIFPASSDLDGLALSHGDLTPAFSPSVVDYTAQVENSVSAIAVTPTPAESHSTVAVNGTPVSGGTPIDIPLVVGENVITIVVTALDGQTKTYTITVTRSEPSGSPDPEPNEPTDPEPNEPSDPEPGPTSGPASDQPEDIRVIVDGKPQEQIASGKSSKDKEGRSVFTVTVDAAKLSSQLVREGDQPNVLIPVAQDSDKITAVLTGDAVKAMENKRAVLEVRTPNGSYKLPAVEMFIDRVSSQLGNSKDLSLIEVHVEIARSGEAQTARLEAASENGRFTIAAPPVEFTITVSYNGNTVTVDKFSSYVQREIPLPDGTDPSKITTGVVVEPDGTVRHVPTKVILIDGKYYAKINSLTNSTYAVVWHPLEFGDVSNHWAKEAVNDMGSRMIIEGIGNGLFHPDRDITRAEFVAIIVRALGLKLESGTSVFSDVKESDWYGSAINTAYAYHLAGGFEDGTFRPNDKVTREQAMVILSKAMAITGLKAKLSVHSVDAALRPYTDAAVVSAWAQSSIADCLQAGIVSGRSGTALAPKDSITRAEVAAMVERLLQKSGLI